MTLASSLMFLLVFLHSPDMIIKDQPIAKIDF